MNGRTVSELEAAPDAPGADVPERVQWRNEATVAAQRITERLQQLDGSR